jgi:hypothetical protein
MKQRLIDEMHTLISEHKTRSLRTVNINLAMASFDWVYSLSKYLSFEQESRSPGPVGG